MATWISQQQISSTNTRTIARTRYLLNARSELLSAIQAYFTNEPHGTEVTLACLNALGHQKMSAFGTASGVSLNSVKQDIGLYIAILLVGRFGADGVETLRNASTKRSSTRSPGRTWPTLTWVSRYTPHRLTDLARDRLAVKKV